MDAGFLGRIVLMAAYQPVRVYGVRPLFCGAAFFNLELLRKTRNLLRSRYNLRSKFPWLGTRSLVCSLLQPCFFLWFVLLLIWQLGSQIDRASKRTTEREPSLFSYFRDSRFSGRFGTNFALLSSEI
jgi:hypothetical protein